MVTGIEEVEINGNAYRITGPIIEGFVEEFPEGGAQGRREPKDRRGKESWVTSKILGLGDFYTTVVAEEIHVQNSKAETRFGEITNRLLVQDSVLGLTPLVDNKPMVALAHFAGDVGWVGAEVNGANEDARSGTWDGGTDTWQDEASVSGLHSNIHNIFDLTVLGSTLVAYINHGTVVEVNTSSAWAGAWSTVGNIHTSVATDDVFLALTWTPSITVTALFDKSANKITASKNTDTWATTTLTTLATIAAGALTGEAIYYDLSGNLRPVFATDRGVWAIDVDTANNETLVVDLQGQGDANNGLGMIVWNGKLIIPLGDGRIEGREWTGAAMASFSIPTPRLPSTWEGHVTASFATDDWLFIAYGGHSGTDVAHIFAIDTDFNWHFILEHDTAAEEITQMILSSDDDDQSRLHYFAQNGLDVFHVDDPLVNPRSKTIPHETTSPIIFPEFTGGFSHTDKCFIQVVTDSEDLAATTSNGHINVDYGLDDNTVDTDMGNFLSGDKDLVFVDGSSNNTGVQGKTLALQQDLKSTATDGTERVYIRSTVVEYLVIPDRLETYEMVIDVEATAAAQSRTVKEVIDNLNTVQGSKTMVTLQYEGKTAVYVIPTTETITQQELSTMFDVEGIATTSVRYLKLKELL